MASKALLVFSKSWLVYAPMTPADEMNVSGQRPGK